MAENESNDGQERSEEATEERRDEFRKRGDVAHSRELSSAISLALTVAFIGFYGNQIFYQLKLIFLKSIPLLSNRELNSVGVLSYLRSLWKCFLVVVLPLGFVSIVGVSFSTLLQTRFNFTWSKIGFDFQRINPLSGFAKLFSSQALIEVIKSIAKLLVIIALSASLFMSVRKTLPIYMDLSVQTSSYLFLKSLTHLFWIIMGILATIGVADYFYQWFSFEKKIRMSKQELKEEYKQREVDPVVRQKMRKMQRDIISRKTIQATENATVLITNPTHYSVALQYEIGMKAPKVVAKGMDYLALRMRETAKEHNIPIVENVPLARKLYAEVEINEEITESLYKAVSEIIRYVFKLKKIKIPKNVKARESRI